MHDWELDNPYLTALIRLRQAYGAVNRVSEIELGKLQTTLAQVDVLTILNASKGPLTPGEIASYVFREKHSASALLTRMQRAGLVKKVRSRKDQRVVKIQIQPKGKELLAKSLRAEHRDDLLASCFSVEEIQQFDSYLKRLRDCSLKTLGTEATSLPANIDVSQFAAEQS